MVSRFAGEQPPFPKSEKLSVPLPLQQLAAPTGPPTSVAGSLQPAGADTATSPG